MPGDDFRARGSPYPSPLRPRGVSPTGFLNIVYSPCRYTRSFLLAVYLYLHLSGLCSFPSGVSRRTPPVGFKGANDLTRVDRACLILREIGGFDSWVYSSVPSRG